MQQGNPNYGGIAPEYFAPQQQNPERNGLGITSLILGIVGLVFGIVPLTGFLGLILGVTGFILGLAGWSRVRKNKATNKKVSIAGTFVSLGSIVLGIVGIVIVFGAMNDLGEGMDCISDAESVAEMEEC